MLPGCSGAERHSYSYCVGTSFLPRTLLLSIYCFSRRRTMAVNVTNEARRSILVDLLTVHCLGGKAIVFTQTKREADEVAASLSLVHPCEVRVLA